MGCPGAARTAGLWLAEQPRADLGTWGTPAELRAGHRVQEENRSKSEQGRCFSRISGLAASHISVQPKGKCPNHEQRAPTTTLLSAGPHHHFTASARPRCHLAGDSLPAVPSPLSLPSQDSDEKAASCFYFQSFGSGRPAEPPPACCTGASSSTRRTRHQLQGNQQSPAGFCSPAEAQDLPPAPPTCRG